MSITIFIQLPSKQEPQSLGRARPHIEEPHLYLSDSK